MKKLYILLIALVLINSAMAQWPSNCDVSEELELYYETDVKDIATQWLFDVHSPDTVLIDIPQWCQDTIWSGLAAISNRYDISEVDSVFNKYCIHRVMGFVNIKSIVVQLDSNCSWLNNWINLQITTGVPDLDTLFSRYNFTLTHFLNPNRGVLETTEMINLYALCDSLESFVGITNSEPDSWTGNATWYDHIYFSDTSGVRYYSFQKGVGLANRYLWNFKVNTDCSIEFLGNGYPGIAPSDPENCNIFSSVDEYISSNNCFIYPNPSNDKITISATNEITINDAIIYSQTGQKVLQEKPENNTLDISKLKSGMYIVEVVTKEGKERKKLIIK